MSKVYTFNEFIFEAKKQMKDEIAKGKKKEAKEPAKKANKKKADNSCANH
jgi:hypothetical protein